MDLIKESLPLEDFFDKNHKVALAFSGGVDSAYLLYAALKFGADVRPYYIKTMFQPKFETDDAIRLAQQLGIRVTILDHDILAIPNVSENSAARCYYCKHSLLLKLQTQAYHDGYTTLIDGTNASDAYDDRPGMRALRELSVRSPLRECAFTKSQIRKLSKEAGLFTWDKPSYSCLATRIETGSPITSGLLKAIEFSENVLFSLGFSDFRVRVYHKAARIQCTQEQMSKVLELREEICQLLQPYFDIVLLDMRGR